MARPGSRRLVAALVLTGLFTSVKLPAEPEAARLLSTQAWLAARGRSLTLEELTALEKLGFGPSSLKDEELHHLQPLHNLRDLSLTDYCCMPSGWLRGRGLAHLAGLRRLERLSLNYNQIDDAGFRFLPPLPELRDLDLSSTLITDSSLARLRRFISQIPRSKTPPAADSPN
jgi:hypothetical protein